MQMSANAPVWKDLERYYIILKILVNIYYEHSITNNQNENSHTLESTFPFSHLNISIFYYARQKIVQIGYIIFFHKLNHFLR